jgi:hypothetical protein
MRTEPLEKRTAEKALSKRALSRAMELKTPESAELLQSRIEELNRRLALLERSGK